MLDVRRDEVARRMRRADREVHALGRAGGPDDRVGPRADRRRDRVACVLEPRPGRPSRAVDRRRVRTARREGFVERRPRPRRKRGARVVIEDDQPTGPTWAGFFGTTNTTRVPPAGQPSGRTDGGLSAQIFPPRASTTRRAYVRPRPAPPCSRVTDPST